MEHKNIPVGHIHAPFQWVVADSDARSALTVESGDADKLCLQQDTGVAYRLSSVSPVAWSLFNPHDADQDLAISTSLQTANAAVSAASTAQTTADEAATAAATAQQTADGKAPTAHTHTAAQISDATTVGKAVMTAADAAAARSTLGLANHQLVTVDSSGGLRAGSLNATGAVQICITQSYIAMGTEGSYPAQVMVYSPGPTDAKLWDVYCAGDLLDWRCVNDAMASACSWLTVRRNGYTPSSISFPNGRVQINTTDDGANTLQVGGSGSINGGLTVAGTLLAGAASGDYHILRKNYSAGSQIVGFGPNGGDSHRFYVADVGGASASASLYSLDKIGATGRSINAAGTVNTAGNDYAEYERANGAIIAKGAIVGFKADGTLTLKFSEAIRFGIKSTNPSYVGGDTWATEDQIGKRPVAPQFTAHEYAGSQKPADLAAKPVSPTLNLPAEPVQQDGETDETFAVRVAEWQQACQEAEEQTEQAREIYATTLAGWEALSAAYKVALAQYEADQTAYKAAVKTAQTEFDTVTLPAYKTALADWEAKLEAARVLVDRVAYSGKVPVNVTGATPGDYIIAGEAADGSIAGQIVADPDFPQYKKAVGRVNRILEDGRAEVAVIVH